MAKPKPIIKNCQKCGDTLAASGFYPTNSPFFPDGYTSICRSCLKNMVDPLDWSSVDHICQWANYPFRLDKWTPLAESQGREALTAYIELFCTLPYDALNWDTENASWRKALEENSIAKLVPVMDVARLKNLRAKWGSTYGDEDLNYMEDYYQNLEKAYNIITELQREAARNLAKLSVRISQKIGANQDIDKDIKSQSEIIKNAGFSIDHAKNMDDFESVGELVAYLEKTGWENRYYNGVTKDIVDETIANMQLYNKRIITGEASLKEQVENKLAALGIGDSVEDGMTNEVIKYYEEGGSIEVDDEFDGEEDDISEELIF